MFNYIHPNITARIDHLLEMGVTTRMEMKCNLRTYVKEKFGQNTNEMYTAYFPSNRMILSTMYNSMMRLRNSKFDLENVLEMVKLWKQDNPNDLIYFWPKTSEDEIDFSQNGSTESDDDDLLYEVAHIHNKRVQALLLFLHITQAQRELLKCYNNLVLMDATYHTCRLMLPTFLWL